MSWRSVVNRAVRIGIDEGLKFLRESQSKDKQGRGPGPRDDRRPPRPTSPGRPSPADRAGDGRGRSASAGYPGDFPGEVRATYSPRLDGDADPGEVVWGWVPYEEDHSRGKDRPALIVGRDGRWVLALMLTSRDHVPGGLGEIHSEGRSRWMNVGSGAWDSQGRPSEVRLDRVIRLDPNEIRREGAIMDREVFDLIAKSLGGR
ncbi:PemK-like, MazF-like toxin of type II toxin-antitoxin system [Brevibacterium sanguinis]|uniref:PemK-like, MazF-like toxin of type II toxin-antitoxin system n=2 Tax=Brevibacterium TaxID=1696 RepID=A0A366IIV0_9MICO|nr:MULTISPECIES: type II toxin-antitoxin system PemK/MazF family toxin [Brevibacterium]RBP63940.1 PemK-like, MazF-like toxin of type II toxin-antitoxin system [Brevibacterium sanguinis]RBP70785.1 PemK-like, MazF-like toxin of type II toxin-antitoxin system [Brevibacterium celere]